MGGRREHRGSRDAQHAVRSLSLSLALSYALALPKVASWGEGTTDGARG